MQVTRYLPCGYIHSPKAEVVLFIPMTNLVVSSRSLLRQKMPRSSHMDQQKEMLSTTQMHSSSILIYEEVHFDSISLFLLALITFEYPVNWEVFAESPSFSRQEINTGSHNEIQVNAITHTQTKVDYKGPLDNPSRIQ